MACPAQVSSAYLEDVAVFLRWRGSSCTIAVEAPRADLWDHQGSPFFWDTLWLFSHGIDGP